MPVRIVDDTLLNNKMDILKYFANGLAWIMSRKYNDTCISQQVSQVIVDGCLSGLLSNCFEHQFFIVSSSQIEPLT